MPGEECAGGDWFLQTRQKTLQKHVTAIGSTKDSYPGGGILCECHTLADVRQKIPGQAYPEAANIGETELGAFLHLCKVQASCELLPMNEAQEGPRSVVL